MKWPGQLFVVMVLLAMVGGLSGCSSLIQRVGISILYRKAELPEQQVHQDIAYIADGMAKHRLNLFTPTGTNWPTFIFVYGGGWTEGDKDQTFGGADVYNNIGRYYAARGIGVAVVNYRLMPEFTAEEQLSDVANAVAWVHGHIAEYGGDTGALFIGGHSAGAQIADRVAFDAAQLARVKLTPKIFCGVISVSGAGLAMTDQKTYQLGESPSYFAERFDPKGTNANWPTDESPLTYAKAGAPPVFIAYAKGETKSLVRQGQYFSEQLSARGVKNELLPVKGESHARMALLMSKDGNVLSAAITNFIAKTRCP